MVFSEQAIEALIHGFLISITIITSVGPQNAYVIRYGLAKRFVPYVLLTCILSDFILFGIGVYGTAEIFERYYYSGLVVGICGILFLLYCSFDNFKSAFGKDEDFHIGSRVSDSLKRAILQGLAFAFLNPAAIMDTVVIVGGVSSQYETDDETLLYFIGAALASITWFTSIGLFTKILYPYFQKPISWKILDFISGTIMLLIAYFLADGLYEKFCL
ncbi:MAG: LysE family transporter [Rickettsiales bacterium]